MDDSFEMKRWRDGADKCSTQGHYATVLGQHLNFFIKLKVIWIVANSFRTIDAKI